MVTLFRRLVGLALVVVAGLIYADMAEKGRSRYQGIGDTRPR